MNQQQSDVPPVDEIQKVSYGDTSTALKTSGAVMESVENIRQYLLGKVLTLVDASYTDPVQRKAMKDVIKQAFNEKEYYSDRVVHLIYQAMGEDDSEWFGSSAGGPRI